MRKLLTKDLFSAMRVVRAGKMHEELKPVFKMASEENANAENVGIEMVLTLMETLSEKNTEHVIYEFLAGPFEMDPKEIADMELDTLLANLGQLARENDLANFIRQLGNLTTSK